MKKGILKKATHCVLKIVGITVLSFSTLQGIFVANRREQIEKNDPQNVAALKQNEKDFHTALGLSFAASGAILASMALKNKDEKGEEKTEDKQDKVK